MKDQIKLLLLTICCSIFLMPFCHIVRAEPSDDSQWKSLETKYSTLRYRSFDDLTKFHKKINYSPEGWSIKSLFGGLNSNNLEDKIIKKIDALHERAQGILGMHKKMKKVTIILYSNKDQLRNSYSMICNGSTHAYGHASVPRAFFIFKFNNICINAEDLHEGILAHEMAHFIVDNFLSLQPPKPTAEILARYVDKHLFDK